VIAAVEMLFLYSRIAWVAAAAIGAAAIAVNNRHRMRVAAAAVALTVAGVATALTNETVRTLALNSVGLQQSARAPVAGMASPSMRAEIWERTLTMIGDFPLAGVGPGNFRAVFETTYNPEVNDDLRRGVHAHNLWLQQTAEMGVPGGIAFVALWIAGLWTAWRAVRHHRSAATLGIFLALIGVTVVNVTDSMPGEVNGMRLYLLTWILFGLAAGEGSFGAAERRS
jgi:O-antigen ligase